MKKLISLIFVALISSQMWATAFYVYYGDQSTMSSMGTISISGNNKNGSGHGGTINVSLYDVTITATPNSGYMFLGWKTSTSSSSYVSESASYTFYGNYSAATKYYAYFAKETKNVTVNRTGSGTTNYAVPSDAVDMGLSVAWGTKNLGASSSTGTGGWYAWGEVTARTNFGSSSNYTSTASSNNANLSGATYDAATYELGEGWRMPTKSEWEDLVTSLNTTNSYSSTTKAYTITSKKTGNSIQIPLCGINQSNTGAYSVGSGAYYWSSTYKSGGTGTSKKPYYFKATTSSINTVSQSDQYCYYGMQIRPVYDAGTTYTLTINVGSNVYKYVCAPGTIINVTMAAESGYTVAWSDGDNHNPRSFTMNSNITKSVTYTANVTYVTATFNNYDGTQLAQYTNVVSGTQPTYSGSTPTKPSTQTVSEVTTYSFTGWSPALGAITTNTTYTAQFSSSTSPRQYLIRFLQEDGETVIDSRNVAYGDKPTAPADEDMTKTADESYTYAFAGWDANNDGIVDEVANVTGAQDYVAVFTATPIVVVPTYNITVGAYSNGTVTLTAGGDVQVVPAEGGVYNYLEGTTIIVKATANRGFHFTEWSDHTTTASVRVREIDENKTLTPSFAANTPFTMYDTWTEADCMSNYDFTNTLTVVLDGRTFTADQWATLSVPFTTTLTADDALYNMVYRLSVATLSQDGGSMHFEFVRTNVIEANEPYLIVPRQAVNEVVFYGVKLETPVEKHPTTDNRVEFVSSLWKQTIYGRNEFYVGANSTLRYASTTGTTVKGNRAFFRKINDAASAPRRVVISIDGVETTKVLTEDGELVDTTTKRMENGILIIERNGVRMDALGNRID